MSLFARLERRSESRGMSLQDELAQRRLVSNGVVVTPEMSIQKIAVFASANLLASSGSTMPVDLYTGSGVSKKNIKPPLLLTDPDASGYGLVDWLWEVFFWTLIRGNAVGHIAERDRRGNPAVVVLQPLDQVRPRLDRKTGKTIWTLGNLTVPAKDVWHFRPFPVAGRVFGLSPVGLHMRTIGLGIQAEEFGAQFFADGGHPSAILSANGQLDKKQADAVKARWRAATSGNREPVVMPADIKYQKIQIAPNESQFLETQKYTSAECARIFGPAVPEMLGYETGGPLTYDTPEKKSIHLLTYGLNPWLVRMEKAVDRLLPEQQWMKFNRKSVLATSTLDRFKAHQIAIASRFATVNEVREIEDETPVPWGDEPAPWGTKTATSGEKDSE